MKFNLINYSRVFCACQHCHFSFVRFSLVGGVVIFGSVCGRYHRIVASAEKDILATKTYSFFSFRKDDAIWRWWKTVIGTLHIHFQRTNSLDFILITIRAFDVCVNSRSGEKAHFNLCAQHFLVYFESIRLSVFRSHHYLLNGCWRLGRATIYVFFSSFFFFESHSNPSFTALSPNGAVHSNQFRNGFRCFLVFGQFELIDWLTLIDNRFQNILSDSKWSSDNLSWSYTYVCICVIAKWMRCTNSLVDHFPFQYHSLQSTSSNGSNSGSHAGNPDVNRFMSFLVLFLILFALRFDRRHSWSVLVLVHVIDMQLISEAFALRTTRLKSYTIYQWIQSKSNICFFETIGISCWFLSYLFLLLIIFFGLSEKWHFRRMKKKKFLFRFVFQFMRPWLVSGGPAMFSDSNI